VPGAAQGFEAMDARVRPRSGLFPAAGGTLRDATGLSSGGRDGGRETNAGQHASTWGAASFIHWGTARVGGSRARSGAAPLWAGSPLFFFFSFFHFSRTGTSTEITSGLLPAACQVGFPAWLETLRDLAQAVRAVFLSRSRVRVGRLPCTMGGGCNLGATRPWERS